MTALMRRMGVKPKYLIWALVLNEVRGVICVALIVHYGMHLS